jgi:hypothetical protein
MVRRTDFKIQGDGWCPGPLSTAADGAAKSPLHEEHFVGDLMTRYWCSLKNVLSSGFEGLAL